MGVLSSKIDRRLALGVGIGVLIVAVVMGGWLVWGRDALVRRGWWSLSPDIDDDVSHALVLSTKRYEGDDAHAEFDVGQFPSITFSDGSVGLSVMQVRLRPGYRVTCFSEEGFRGAVVLTAVGPHRFETDTYHEGLTVGSVRVTFAPSLADDDEYLL